MVSFEILITCHHYINSNRKANNNKNFIYETQNLQSNYSSESNDNELRMTPPVLYLSFSWFQFQFIGLVFCWTTNLL